MVGTQNDQIKNSRTNGYHETVMLPITVHAELIAPAEVVCITKRHQDAKVG